MVPSAALLSALLANSAQALGNLHSCLLSISQLAGCSSPCLPGIAMGVRRRSDRSEQRRERLRHPGSGQFCFPREGSEELIHVALRSTPLWSSKASARSSSPGRSGACIPHAAPHLDIELIGLVMLCAIVCLRRFNDSAFSLYVDDTGSLSTGGEKNYCFTVTQQSTVKITLVSANHRLGCDLGLANPCAALCCSARVRDCRCGTTTLRRSLRASPPSTTSISSPERESSVFALPRPCCLLLEVWLIPAVLGD